MYPYDRMFELAIDCLGGQIGSSVQHKVAKSRVYLFS